MGKPHLLQAGAYPPGDQELLDAAFTAHRLWEAADRAAFLAEVGPKVRAIATRGDLGASAEVIAACREARDRQRLWRGLSTRWTCLPARRGASG